MYFCEAVYGYMYVNIICYKKNIPLNYIKMSTQTWYHAKKKTNTYIKFGSTKSRQQDHFLTEDKNIIFLLFLAVCVCTYPRRPEASDLVGAGVCYSWLWGTWTWVLRTKIKSSALNHWSISLSPLCFSPSWQVMSWIWSSEFPPPKHIH